MSQRTYLLPSGLFRKEFISKRRMLLDMSARVMMPEWSIPKLFVIGDNYYDMEYLPYEIDFTDFKQISKIFNYLAKLHKFLEEKFISAHIILKNSNSDEIINLNKKCFDILNITPCLPVKIGDLKPEHLRYNINKEIVICDYETLGLGCLLEDFIFLSYSLTEDTINIWFLSIQEYFYIRFGIKVDKNKIIKAFMLTFNVLSEKFSELEACRYLWASIGHDAIK